MRLCDEVFDDDEGIHVMRVLIFLYDENIDVLVRSF